MASDWIPTRLSPERLAAGTIVYEIDQQGAFLQVPRRWRRKRVLPASAGLRCPPTCARRLAAALRDAGLTRRHAQRGWPRGAVDNTYRPGPGPALFAGRRREGAWRGSRIAARTAPCAAAAKSGNRGHGSESGRCARYRTNHRRARTGLPRPGSGVIADWLTDLVGGRPNVRPTAPRGPAGLRDYGGRPDCVRRRICHARAVCSNAVIYPGYMAGCFSIAGSGG